LLGYLAPDRFLGGDMGLDVDGATAACARLGEVLALSADEVAWGIREIALVGMAKAVRGRLAERGLDPRGRALISFGGCGGLFAADIARAIGMDTVVVPELASVLSAFGAATADVRRERAQSLEMAFPVDIDTVSVIAEKLRGQVDADVAADGVAPDDRSVLFEADLRFKRQKWELTVPLTGALAGAEGFDQLIADFRAEYARRYGEGALMAGAVVELVSVRAIGVGRTVKPDLTPTEATAATGGAPPRASVRSVRVARGTAPISVDVYAGAELLVGHEITGPALVDGVDTTVWIPPACTLRVDTRNNFIMEVN
jgi:N-methylhydantoinase A